MNREGRNRTEQGLIRIPEKNKKEKKQSAKEKAAKNRKKRKWQ